MRDTIVLRTNEICLKGANRGLFEKRLTADVRGRLAVIGRFDVRRDQGNVLVRHDGPMTDAQASACATALADTFGVAWVVFGARVPKTLEAIKETAAALIATKAPATFKVFAKRGDKSFPHDSQHIARGVGAHLLETVPGLSVDVHDPAVRVAVDVGNAEAFVSVDRVQGAGGLPAGIAGKVVTMLSGGIDSPVAAWKVMRRGCTPVFVHFHSYPYVGRASVEKVRRLAATLDAWAGGGSVLYMVPIGDAQRDITAAAGESFRVLLYRRLMFRIAERIAAREKAHAVVTGDSVGQVASQTLENIAAVSAHARMPIFRPLIGDDKEDIVRVAKRIGTFETSIEPHDDCCSLFVPRHPATRATADVLDAEEAKYDPDAMAEAALAAAERVIVAAAAHAIL